MVSSSSLIGLISERAPWSSPSLPSSLPETSAGVTASSNPAPASTSRISQSASSPRAGSHFVCRRPGSVAGIRAMP